MYMTSMQVIGWFVMKKIFLIDTENVGGNALSYAQRISIVEEDAEFILFFTNNCKTVRLSSLCEANNYIRLKSICCDCGKEMLDKELLAYLAVHANVADVKYIVVTKDKEFSTVVGFIKKYVPNIDVEFCKTVQAYYDREIYTKYRKEVNICTKLTANLGKLIMNSDINGGG